MGEQDSRIYMSRRNCTDCGLRLVAYPGGEICPECSSQLRSAVGKAVALLYRANDQSPGGAAGELILDALDALGEEVK